MAAVITTRGLVKRFGRLRAVDGIDLDVRAGDIYGFLGANGSGKTTTVRMLLGLVLPTSGEIELLGGRMPRAGRRVLPRVGALIEGPAHYGHLSGRENLALLDAAGPGVPGPPGDGGSTRSSRRWGSPGSVAAP
jgi:ABC-type multidrug transport system ATPase subunit